MNNKRLNTLISMMIFLLVVSAAYGVTGFKVNNFSDLSSIVIFVILVTFLMKIAHWSFRTIEDFIGYILGKVL